MRVFFDSGDDKVVRQMNLRCMSRMDVHAMKIKAYNLGMHSIKGRWLTANASDKRKLEEQFWKMKTGAYMSNTVKKTATLDFVGSTKRIHEFLDYVIKLPPMAGGLTGDGNRTVQNAETRRSMVVDKLYVLYDGIEGLDMKDQLDLLRVDMQDTEGEGAEDAMYAGWMSLRERLLTTPSPVLLETLY